MKTSLIILAFAAIVLNGCRKDPFLTDNSGIFKDCRDIIEYNWVRIGEQIWMAENLAYLPNVSPSISVSDTIPVYHVYEYEGTNVNVARSNELYLYYGALYNWEAAKTACPAGWKLPEDDDWKVLEKHLGMTESDADSTGWRKSGDVGKKMKSLKGWLGEGNGDNSSGFNALPAGCRYANGGFTAIGWYAHFWSSTEYDSLDTWRRLLMGGRNGISRQNQPKREALSVRCIKIAGD
jgi:uncharacterized protein (TIGR02145 family)